MYRDYRSLKSFKGHRLQGKQIMSVSVPSSVGKLDRCD